MLFAIDIGNTRTKIALFENDTLLELFIFEAENFLENFKKIISKAAIQPQTVLSSVGKLDRETLLWLETHTDLLCITPDSALPLANQYATPKTLGMDRLVLAAGASLAFPSKNCLVIDAGTCITYELISSEKGYLGGAISPGIGLRYKALHQYTNSLPLLERENPVTLIGNNTHSSIHAGVVGGISAEIDGMIENYRANFQDLTIILTGGDAVFLAKRLKNTIFANSNFLLESLNALHQYIIDNDKKNLSRP